MPNRGRPTTVIRHYPTNLAGERAHGSPRDPGPGTSADLPPSGLRNSVSHSHLTGGLWIDPNEIQAVDSGGASSLRTASTADVSTGSRFRPRVSGVAEIGDATREVGSL
jgi:hypothetical protein